MESDSDAEETSKEETKSTLNPKLKLLSRFLEKGVYKALHKTHLQNQSDNK